MSRALGLWGMIFTLAGCGLNPPVRTTQDDDAGMIFGRISGVGAFGLYLTQNERSGIAYRQSVLESTAEGLFYKTDLPPVEYHIPFFISGRDLYRISSDERDLFQLGPGELLFAGSYEVIFDDRDLGDILTGSERYALLPLERPSEADVLAMVREEVDDPKWKRRIDAQLEQLSSLTQAGAPEVTADVAEPAPPQVVSGSLDPEQIRRLVQAYHPEFRRCYQRALRRDPEVEGKLTVRFVIGPNGVIREAEVEEDTVGDPGLPKCVLRAYRRIRFPRPEQGKVTVVYPLAFGAK